MSRPPSLLWVLLHRRLLRLILRRCWSLPMLVWLLVLPIILIGVPCLVLLFVLPLVPFLLHGRCGRLRSALSTVLLQEAHVRACGGLTATRALWPEGRDAGPTERLAKAGIAL